MVIHLAKVSQAIRARGALEEWIDDLTVDEGTRRRLRRLPIAARLQVYVLVTRMQAHGLEYVDLSVLDSFLPQMLLEYSSCVQLMLVLSQLVKKGDRRGEAHRALNAACAEWEGAAGRVLYALQSDNDERMCAVARAFVPVIMDLAACLLLRFVGMNDHQTSPSQSQPTLR